MACVALYQELYTVPFKNEGSKTFWGALGLVQSMDASLWSEDYVSVLVYILGVGMCGVELWLSRS